MDFIKFVWNMQSKMSTKAADKAGMIVSAAIGAATMKRLIALFYLNPVMPGFFTPICRSESERMH